MCITFEQCSTKGTWVLLPNLKHLQLQQYFLLGCFLIHGEAGLFKQMECNSVLHTFFAATNKKKMQTLR